MPGSHCQYCDRRCFLLRVLPLDARPPWAGKYLHLATCAAGMDRDEAETGYTHETAINPLDPEHADRLAEAQAGPALNRETPTVQPFEGAPPAAPVRTFRFSGGRTGTDVDLDPAALVHGVTPEPPPGSIQWRDGWENGYAQAAQERRDLEAEVRQYREDLAQVGTALGVDEPTTPALLRRATAFVEAAEALASVWQASPDTLAAITDRYPGLAHHVDRVIRHVNGTAT